LGRSATAKEEKKTDYIFDLKFCKATFHVSAPSAVNGDGTWHLRIFRRE